LSLHIKRLFHLSVCLRELLRLVTRESTRFDKKDSEPEAQIMLLNLAEEN